eukprot:scaffold50582_cov62-Phaeocystis_antarctica.AAC.2
MRISKADAPMPFPVLVSEPSFGTGLKNTSRAPSSLSSTPTVASSAGTDSARESTSHGGICGDGGGGDGGGGLGDGGGGDGGGGIAGGGGEGGGEETTHESSFSVARLSKLLASGAMQPVIA